MSKKKQADDVPPPPQCDPLVYVRVVSGDGHVFIVDRNCIRASKVLAACLPAADGTSQPLPPIAGIAGIEVDRRGLTPRITIRSLTAPQLDAVLRFTHYKYKCDLEAADVRATFKAAIPAHEMRAACSLLGV